MKKFGMFLMAVALASGLSSLAAAQSWQEPARRGDGNRFLGQNQDRDRGENSWYNRGYRQGQQDAQSGRRSARFPGRERDDRRAWEQGYEAGWRAARDHGRGNGPGYGGGGGRSVEQARQVGYQDGLAKGQSDRATGHSYRPTQHDAYKDADHQYSVIGGDKNQYKQLYRQGFMEGYQRGYNGR